MSRPLSGTTILVTRPREQSRFLQQELESFGAVVLVQPAIEIVSADSTVWNEVDKVVDRLNEYEWLVFVSENAVRFFFDRYEIADYRGRIIVTGPETAGVLKQYGVKDAVIPEKSFNAEGILECLRCEPVANKKIAIFRGNRGRTVLPEQLSHQGADVRQLAVYESRDVTELDREIVAKMHSGQIHWTTVTSSAIAKSLVRLFGEDLRKTQLVSISPITSTTLRNDGFIPDAEAPEATIAGMVTALIAKY